MDLSQIPAVAGRLLRCAPGWTVVKRHAVGQEHAAALQAAAGTQPLQLQDSTGPVLTWSLVIQAWASGWLFADVKEQAVVVLIGAVDVACRIKRKTYEDSTVPQSGEC
jgi:hypothetical protein